MPGFDDSFDDLVAFIGDTLSRSDLEDQEIPNFIRLAELDIQRTTGLRLRFTDIVATGLTMTSGVNNILLTAMDPNMVELKWLTMNLDRKRRVEIVNEETFMNVQENVKDNFPHVATHRGLSLYLAPTPQDAHPYDAFGYGGIPALGEANQNNWLLDNAGDVLYYGALMQAEAYIEDDPRIATWAAFYQNGVKTLKRQEKRIRLGGGPLRMRPDVVS